VGVIGEKSIILLINYQIPELPNLVKPEPKSNKSAHRIEIPQK